jgi:hypothetical protein
METDVVQIAAAAAATLAPFLPFLAELGKAGGRKLAEVIAEKGGEAAWNRARGLWEKIRSRCEDDLELESASAMVATKPEDETRQTMLAEVLAARLQEDPELTHEFLAILGGQEAIQEVLADRSSWVENVTQHIEGSGKQVVRACDDSFVKDVRQSIE